MKSSKLSLLLCLWLVVSGAVLGAGSEPLLQDILRNNLAATRTDAFAGPVRNTEKLLEISEGGYVLAARYRATADGHMRIDVFIDGERVYSEGLDDEGAWEWPGGSEAPENVYHEGAGALAHGIEFNLFALAELPGRGHRIELLGRESLRGTDYFVLRLVLADGFETYRYVNASTWRVDLSRDVRAFHPGIDDTKQHLETRYDRWQTAEGVVFASRSQNIDLATGDVIATTRVLSSRYNLAREALDLARSYVPRVAPSRGDPGH